MLTKLTDTISLSLFPLLSALFIAAGMPLLHPVVHDHSESYHIIFEHHDEHIAVFADENHEPNCPICGFPATSQLYDTGKGHAITEIELVDNIISIKGVFLAKTFPMRIEPRGISTYELILMGVVCLAGCLIGKIPGYQIYRYSLADGMTIRI